MSLSSAPGRALLLAALLVLALGACGRRGSLEAPLTAAEAARQQSAQARQVQEDADDDEAQGVVVPTPTPARRRSRSYTVPKEPFILDPLL